MDNRNFKPEKDYKGLLKQAYAMNLLIQSMRKNQTFQDLKIEDISRQLSQQSIEEINAQRKTNEALTNEVEALEKKLKDVVFMLGIIKKIWPYPYPCKQLDEVIDFIKKTVR